MQILDTASPKLEEMWEKCGLGNGEWEMGGKKGGQGLMNEQPNPLGLAMPSTRVPREPLDASSSSSWFPSHVNILFVVWFSLVLLFPRPSPERQKSIGNFSASSAAGIPPIIVCLSQVLHCLMSDLFAFGLWSMQLINFTYPLAHTHTYTHSHMCKVLSNWGNWMENNFSEKQVSKVLGPKFAAVATYLCQID